MNYEKNKKDKVQKEIINTIQNNNISEKEVEQLEYEPMGDDDIRHYYPNSRIVTYPELKKYKTMEQLLPKDKDYIFLLFLSTPNSGHWCLLSNNNNVYEFFCSYGSSPSTPLRWLDSNKRKELGQQIPYLDNLLSRTNKDVIYNPIDYQNNRDLEVSTCGRHDCFRLMTILKHNMSLTKYYEIMKNLKSKLNMTYDEIVSDYINKL